MNPSTTDQLNGAIHQVKGTAKEAVGTVINDPDLVTEGQTETLAGKVQEKVGQIEKVFEK